jgi:nitroreductase
MKLIDAIRGRRSVREYTEASIDEPVLAQLIDAAIQAPNAMNRQAWSFLVITDRTVLRRISEKAKASMLASMASNPALQPFEEHLSQPEFDIFYAAAALVVICTSGQDDFGRHDCCLAAENLMLAAYAEGLGSCWIGFAEHWLGQPEARAELAIAEHVRPVAPIILGHPRRRLQPPGRRAAEISWIRG